MGNPFPDSGSLLYTTALEYCCPTTRRLTSGKAAGPDVKVRNAIKLIEDDGWSLVATRGSHRQYKHLVKPGRVTIAGKLSDELAPGTWNSILKQAGLKEAR
jgi:predicted RNA binding protein YcfA (HicA-like mRNA interferase family)